MKKSYLKKHYLNTKRSGFTLIELLLVIMLIMVLSGVVLGVLNPSGIRSKARDNQRIADLKKIQSALELYFSDNRVYPVAASWTAATAISGLGTYLSPIPPDPQVTGTTPCNTATRNYMYQSNGSRYILTANMEITADASGSLCTTANLGCTAPANCYMVGGPDGVHTAGSGGSPSWVTHNLSRATYTTCSAFCTFNSQTCSNSCAPNGPSCVGAPASYGEETVTTPGPCAPNTCGTNISAVPGSSTVKCCCQ